MKRIALALAVLLAVAGCEKPGHSVKKITVDGTTCIEAQSARGIAIDCDWPAR